MKILINIKKESINKMVCTRYIEGYSEYDPQYKDLVNTLVNNFQAANDTNDFYKEMYNLIGEFNIITKNLYEDVIIQIYKLQYNKVPKLEEVYEIINNILTHAIL